nr:PREDICTED: putative gustatory receptor 28b [Tribolium castaneum]|eukprot:XP_015837721.1 PREDICTED: putative gustatory receptor 28b [Tribolium castaneum]
MNIIHQLSLHHYELVQISQNVTKNFEITTLVASLLWFKNMIETVYYLLFVMVNGTDRPIVHYGCNITFLVLHLYWLFVVVRIYVRVKNEANQSASYIHEIWNKYAVKRVVDRKIRFLQLIVVQFYATKLNFTAFDVVSLDWSFCQMMIASITTYVVILIQFQI